MEDNVVVSVNTVLNSQPVNSACENIDHYRILANDSSTKILKYEDQ